MNFTSREGKKKILMLHGFAQSGKIFKSKTGGLRKNLNKLGFELYYPTAPHLVTKEILRALHGPPEESTNESSRSSSDMVSKFNSSSTTDDIYGWYLKKAPDFKAFDIELATLGTLHDYIIENGPFDGLIGFSQGAGFAGYLLTNFNKLLNLTEEQQPSLKFFISFSGFKLDDPKFHEFYDKSPISIPSLNVLGELDSVVCETRVLSLYNACQEDARTLLKHSGGHFVPNSKQFITQICNWLRSVTSDLNHDTNSTKTEPQNSAKPELDADLLDMIDSIGKI